MTLQDEAETRRASIAATLAADIPFQRELDSIAEALLGRDLMRSIGRAGRQHAELQAVELLIELDPRPGSPGSAPDPVRVLQLFVVGLSCAARERFSVQAAIADGYSSAAAALAHQVAAVSMNPRRWGDMVGRLRERGAVARIQGAFPQLSADGFNVVLVTVLADEVRVDLERERAALRRAGALPIR